MKKFTTLFITLILTIVILFNITLLTAAVPISNVFKEGIYKVSSNSGDFNPGDYRFELISKNSICYVYVIDKNYIQRYSKRFDSTDNKNTSAIFSIGTLLEGDNIIILGDGEMYFNNIKELSQSSFHE